MKKLKLSKYVIVATLFVAMLGCDSILENVEPSNAVSGEVVLTTENGVNALRASMYAKVYQSFSFTTDYFVGPSAFSDETRNRPGSSRYQAYNNAEGTFGTTHMGNWGAGYDLIQDANLIIGAVEDGVLPAATLAQYRAEALALRAFAYHNMVRVYGYEPGNFGQGPEANWNAGVIIRNEPVIDVSDADFRPRSTVGDVYTAILADLNEAETLFTANGDGGSNTYVTLAFVHGMQARANLYAGNWQAAADAAQDAIDEFGGTLSNTQDAVTGMFNETSTGGNHPEALFKLVINPNTEGIAGGSGNNGPATYTSDGFMAQLPTQFVIDQYRAGDFRLGWYQPCADVQKNPLTQPTNCDAVNTAGLSSVKWSGDKLQSVDDLPMMRLAEMYLIRAEGLAKASNNAAAGSPALQALLDARNGGTVPAAALTSVDAFEDEILIERIRELAIEGHRFYDLKRLGRAITNPDGSTKMRADSYRILAPLGSGLLNVNELLVENPEYEDN
ncbi:MAG: hypothetical protein CL670_07095 [Balneola sp.]|nr:hypothetical protein [Balneola sp.]MBE78901.1 hypothetical protein [Balneola sp.]|tara:strand:- start:46829 stop:48334 length:1506 start_codon:yes stop_codon:yes gene_type:complete